MDIEVVAPYIQGAIRAKYRGWPHLAADVELPFQGSVRVDSINVAVEGRHINSAIGIKRGGRENVGSCRNLPFQGSVRVDGIDMEVI